MDDLERFRLAAVEEGEELDDASGVGALRRDLERLVLERLGAEGIAGVERLVEALNRSGHRFETRSSSPGWTSWFQATNGGARHFYIHVEPEDELPTVMVLYQETLETTVRRRRSAMSPAERAAEERADTFYERAMALVDRDYATLSESDRMLTCLHELVTGVHNGGFAAYVSNTEGARLSDAKGFLERVGAETTAAIVSEVIALVPSLDAGMDADAWSALEAREEELSSLDERFFAYPEDVAALTLDYLERRGGTGG